MAKRGRHAGSRRHLVETSIARIGPKGTVFVAELDGAVVGFASVAREVAFTGEAQAYIGELAVTAGAEGQGIGQALLAAVEAWAREQRLHLLVLGYRSGERTRETLLQAGEFPGGERTAHEGVERARFVEGFRIVSQNHPGH